MTSQNLWLPVILPKMIPQNLFSTRKRHPKKWHIPYLHMWWLSPRGNIQIGEQYWNWLAINGLMRALSLLWSMHRDMRVSAYRLLLALGTVWQHDWGPLRDLGLRVSRTYFNGLRAPKDKIAVLQGSIACSSGLQELYFLKFEKIAMGLSGLQGSKLSKWWAPGLQRPPLWGLMIIEGKSGIYLSSK